MTCTGARLAAFFAMDSQLSVPRDVHRSRVLRFTNCGWPTYAVVRADGMNWRSRGIARTWTADQPCYGR